METSIDLNALRGYTFLNDLMPSHGETTVRRASATIGLRGIA